MGGICPCGSVIMNVIDIAQIAFNALPNVNRVWVDAHGKFHLHPHNGGTLVERHAAPVESIKEEAEPVAELPKKKKKK